jgi:hypothetical protein
MVNPQLSAVRMLMITIPMSSPAGDFFGKTVSVGENSIAVRFSVSVNSSDTRSEETQSRNNIYDKLNIL